jgi:hypothetical protein
MAKKIVKRTNNLFIADLGNVKLSAAQLDSIAAGIQEVVMLELAGLDNGAIVTAKPPKGWETRGIVARPIRDIEGLSNSPFAG